MPRVCFLIALCVSLNGCAEYFPVAEKIGEAVPGKGILACTGLPLAGQKCEAGFSSQDAVMASSSAQDKRAGG